MQQIYRSLESVVLVNLEVCFVSENENIAEKMPEGEYVTKLNPC